MIQTLIRVAAAIAMIAGAVAHVQADGCHFNCGSAPGQQCGAFLWDREEIAEIVCGGTLYVSGRPNRLGVGLADSSFRKAWAKAYDANGKLLCEVTDTKSDGVTVWTPPTGGQGCNEANAEWIHYRKVP